MDWNKVKLDLVSYCVLDGEDEKNYYKNRKPEECEPGVVDAL